MEKLKDINTSPMVRCDILRLSELGYAPLTIAEKLGCTPQAVRAFLRTERRLTVAKKPVMAKRLYDYLSENRSQRISYHELINALETYPQALNYAIKILLGRGVIGEFREIGKYKTRQLWFIDHENNSTGRETTTAGDDSHCQKINDFFRAFS